MNVMHGKHVNGLDPTIDAQLMKYNMFKDMFSCQIAFNKDTIRELAYNQSMNSL